MSMATNAASFEASILSSSFRRMYLNVFDRSSRTMVWTGGTPSPSGVMVSGVGSQTHPPNFC